MRRRHGVPPWRAVPLAMAKVVACGCLALPSPPIADGAPRRFSGVLHAGVVAGLVGRRAPVVYGGTSTPSVDP
jgi:hypothetical protein